MSAMLRYVPVEPQQLPAGHDWLWIECPDGDTFMLLNERVEVALPLDAVEGIAEHVLQDAS